MVDKDRLLRRNLGEADFEEGLEDNVGTGLIAAAEMGCVVSGAAPVEQFVSPDLAPGVINRLAAQETVRRSRADLPGGFGRFQERGGRG
ncbi:MAG TPA: hypothetical protein VNY05_19785 [Candidatus Acidoferrales bacterium]|nr:hypothetical protein [Candidatus Acidoferrales bacterium]